MNTKTRQFLISAALSCLGGVIYSVGINIFLVPYGYFNGNLTGIAQILNDGVHAARATLPDLTGAILFAINLPLLALSFGAIHRSFFVKTLLTLIVQSAAMQWIPTTMIPGLTDPLTAILVGGCIAGFGAGFSLRHGGSGGGVDVLGVYITSKRQGFSVGRVSLAIGLIVYAYSLFQHSLVVVIYSFLFTFVYSKFIDLTHHQTAKASLTIITSEKTVLDYITGTLKRSATYWNGTGAYSGKDLIVISTVVSKYEMILLRKEVRKIDPDVFIMETHDVTVTGTYNAHLFDIE